MKALAILGLLSVVWLLTACASTQTQKDLIQELSAVAHVEFPGAPDDPEPQDIIRVVLKSDAANDRIDDEDFQRLFVALERLPELTALEIYPSDITNSSMIRIAELSNLTYLFVASSEITISGVSMLSALGKLSVLIINSPKIECEDLVELAGFPALTTTHVGEICSLGDVRRLRKSIRNATKGSPMTLQVLL